MATRRIRIRMIPPAKLHEDDPDVVQISDSDCINRPSLEYHQQRVKGIDPYWVENNLHIGREARKQSEYKGIPKICDECGADFTAKWAKEICCPKCKEIRRKQYNNAYGQKRRDKKCAEKELK